jgi:hypothetical protein
MANHGHCGARRGADRPAACSVPLWRPAAFRPQSVRALPSPQAGSPRRRRLRRQHNHAVHTRYYRSGTPRAALAAPAPPTRGSSKVVDGGAVTLSPRRRGCPLLPGGVVLPLVGGFKGNISTLETILSWRGTQNTGSPPIFEATLQVLHAAEDTHAMHMDMFRHGRSPPATARCWQGPARKESVAGAAGRLPIRVLVRWGVSHDQSLHHLRMPRGHQDTDEAPT